MSDDSDWPGGQADAPPLVPGRKTTPLAVALRYDSAGTRRVTARGRGEVAAQILELAAAHGVPVEEDEALAEALSGVELDREIPAELYEAVAAILRFILQEPDALG
ncbi:EscU/YscU/HrcU family type III secretion system export apparatus switch protein [Stappia taiwanensis]|uniref:EscU/YscU/HrcU family type III secretion system export apparatus switch protein n=1 Tax=Stappia taiwanensis TaxID=992267 RepID=A0A838XQ35_9HYPH|nr:EscU/YscU/HrcU family type III secretion system export apparatus switch protein [Stappia taiwanensis]MBA4610706.1 EscU/YscU/HrcU family type III secretion system export apparatus switch protein [Stappia taiwanensis]GGE82761.1 type III secretion protein [Stappia taiwanensis]